MIKTLKILGIAVIGGVITLAGYKIVLEQQLINTAENKIENQVDTLQTMPVNYMPTVVNSIAAPTDFTQAASKTVHAVVHVKNTAVRTQRNPYAQLFGRNETQKYQQVGTGSGVIISPDGYIITNNHVIAGASEIEITLNNRKKLKAVLIGADKSNDIALLKVETDEALPNLAFGNSDNAKVGEWVLAVGNPYNLTSTVTAGIVSAKGRDLDGNKNIEAFIQTDAAVNPGNSGGALVNTRGELIGINTAISSKTGSFIGYSFAVPSNIAKKVVDDLLEFGIVQQAILGISIDATVKDIEGVKIGAITNNSEAKKAGLQQGDIITKVNAVKIAKFSDLKGQLTAKRPGEYVSVTVLRNDKVLTKNVKLGKKETFTSLSFGVHLKDLTSEEKKKYKLKSGAKITRTNNKGFQYYKVGEGYILTKINGKEVQGASQAVSILDTYTGEAQMYLELLSPSGKIERYRF
ncbi:trypsin-like peptidase domain-containing protein [Tenacibaculum finnmarkense]|uniref:PDZ domain-containing protein n=1 Tax=Tenacibaculum finnmarkense genomovar finnmarkense TaxID=1458503 RepID=A0AAP1WGT8_9FLAO|nr:trypsin-like peptidase domain-containing protein [Tenacibaculum finnmarkense]MBE7653410.1 PDZ domain-containing protein [Tenacibaculum finnmarkense genomovar finnmarkense]MBE7695736.1 PDZ domain-containing protein [Tenacibaculum finnmarkense genomovar finnmarkense]MCD8428001.1 trypsin-like peptidase domain-containing protein [Tenacibaculum finnmarkense genomovar finnmarkense]MCG8731678.1 PDZ domain-containing protein [Tenacibaculum finnmarkense]MCG8752234.1 PDZ domain-containing protein [Te